MKLMTWNVEKKHKSFITYIMNKKWTILCAILQIKIFYGTLTFSYRKLRKKKKKPLNMMQFDI